VSHFKDIGLGPKGASKTRKSCLGLFFSLFQPQQAFAQRAPTVMCSFVAKVSLECNSQIKSGSNPLSKPTNRMQTIKYNALTTQSML
jgi:hypothetical protein